jgi:6-phosphogluconolactonase
MAFAMYVSLQGDDKVLRFAFDSDTGQLEPRGETTVSGGPAPMAVHPTGAYLYVARRSERAISSFAIDPSTGELNLTGAVELPSDPPFIFPDRTGRFLLSSYYAAGHVAVHPIGADGAIHGPPTEWIETATGAHSVQTDPSNRFAFLPHIADRGPNEIWQFRFDAKTGHLTPNEPAKVFPDPGAGPRHFCFHPVRNAAYFCNEQASTVTSYSFDPAAGTLSPLQTISTLPDDFNGKNMCAEIRITASGRFLYASNRGHNSIACFSVDSSTGHLTAVGHAPTEAVPRAFTLDAAGRFLYAAGQESGRLASYKIDFGTGMLKPLGTLPLGSRPMWLSIVELRP